MSYKTEFLARARREMLYAWDWYEDKQPGLGDRFINEVYKRAEQVEQAPNRYASKRKGFYETKIEVFPYLIIYRIQKQKRIIAVVSVFHTSRDVKKKYTGLRKV